MGFHDGRLGAALGEGSSAVAVGVDRGGGFLGGTFGGGARGVGPCPCLICSQALNAFAFDLLSSGGYELAASAL